MAVSDDDLATLMYTGGTTGRAKGVMLSHRNLYYCSRSSHEASQAEGITRALTPLPLSHAYGMIVTLVGFHATERALGVLQRWFDPAQFLALAQQHRIQRTALVPAMVQMLLAQPLEDFDLSALRYVNCGAAPLAAETREQWERRVPGSEILEGYGCTESGAVISVNPPGASRPGSAGRPIPGYQVAIRDDNDADVTAGADGEICVRADGVMGGYWNSPAETEATLRGGWLHTGDIGRFDADGYLYVVDRKKDLILRGGFNIFPRDVEDVLLQHPAVAMAGVVGLPRAPRRGDRGVRVAAAGRAGHTGGDHRVRPRTARGAQVPARGNDRGRGAAHQRRETGPQGAARPGHRRPGVTAGAPRGALAGPRSAGLVWALPPRVACHREHDLAVAGVVLVIEQARHRLQVHSAATGWVPCGSCSDAPTGWGSACAWGLSGPGLNARAR